MYLTQILYFLSWPVLILASYYLVKFYIKKLNARLNEDGEES